MIIHVEGFDQNNNLIDLNINIKNKKIKDLGKWAYYDWYKNGMQLDNEYNDWKDNENYEVMFNNDYINLYLKINNKQKLIISPLVSKKISIVELKNILSIKDNIYFKQVKLNDNKTLEDYNISNLDSIVLLPQDINMIVN